MLAAARFLAGTSRLASGRHEILNFCGVDYSSAQGDVLHFTNIDAGETLGGNQDFTFIGTAAFTAPGQINWFTNGTDTFIQLNTDADLAADGIIQLMTAPAGDSVLMFL